MSQISEVDPPKHFRDESGLVHAMRAGSNYKAVCGANRYVGKTTYNVPDPITCVSCRPVTDVEDTVIRVSCTTCKGKKMVIIEATHRGEHYFDIPTPCPDCTTPEEWAHIHTTMAERQKGLAQSDSGQQGTESGI
jgi:hypothetical protein